MTPEMSPRVMVAGTARPDLDTCNAFVRDACVLVVSLIICFIPTMTTCNAMSVERETVLLEDAASTPLSLQRAADEGYLVLLDTYPPVLQKLNPHGVADWAFKEEASGNEIVKFRMASPDASGGVVICADRKGGEGNLEDLPSVVIKLNNRGQEVGRLDSSSWSGGGPIFGISACIPWLDGYAIVANEKRPMAEPDDYGKISGWPYRNVIVRLRSDFSVMWRKPVPIHANPLATTAGPRALPQGALIVAGMDAIFRLNPMGFVDARAILPACKWLRSFTKDDRIRFACARLHANNASTIVEYDAELKIVSRVPLGNEDVGIPTVCEMANGSYAVLGNNGSKGPFIQIYGARGQALDHYQFPRNHTEGAVIDGIPVSPTDIAVARYIDHNDHFVSVITWLSTK